MCVLVRLVVSNSLQPHGWQPVRLLCPWNFQERILEWVAISSSKRSFWPRDWTHVSWISCIESVGSLTLSHLGSPVITDNLYLSVWPAGDGSTKWMRFGECLYVVGVDMCTQSLTFQWTVCLSNILCTTGDLFKLVIIMLSLLTIIDSRMNQWRLTPV